MATYTTPGVYVNETPLSTLVTSQIGSTAAVFFGTAARGPLAPTLIQDWATYKNTFGDLDNAYDLGYAVYHYFSNGGRSCYVRRVLNSAATAASATVPFYPTGNGNASGTLFTATADNAGTWGNNLSVTTTAGLVAATASTYPTFNIVVTLSGTEVERWNEVSIDPNNSRYVQTLLNTYSNYLTVSNVSTAAANVNMAPYLTAVPLAGAAQSTVVDADYTSAFSDLDTVDGTLLLNAVGQTSTTVVSALVNKASTRGDSFVIIDPKRGDATVSDLTTTAANFANLASSGYAAHFTPLLKMQDPAKTGPGALRDTLPGGAVAGLYVRTEIERTIAKAPAGYAADIRGAFATTVNLTDAQIGTLYSGSPSVNAFKVVPGGGVVCYGARTLNRTAADKFVNVRRTLNFIKYNVKNLTNFAVFEPNDSNLWDRINIVVSGFLADLWRSGALQGKNAAEAFYVQCNSSNNTPVTLANGEVHVSVGVALQYPAEFIVIDISQWTGGSNAVESL